jgi:chromate transport protein ChrA
MVLAGASGLSKPVLVVVVLIVVIGLAGGQAALAGWIASRKGRSFAVWFVGGLIVGPLVILCALVLPRRWPGSPRNTARS